MIASLPTRLGFFGKLPAVGDFVRRGLPPEFLQAWDPHFQQAVDTSRRRFGQRWNDAWRTSPTWRFLLPPGMCGGQAWTGVMGPSNDRVGRGFPMVMATPWRVDPSSVRQLLRGGRWFDAVTALHRHAQTDHTFDADALAEAITRLPDFSPLDATSPLDHLPGHASHWRLPLPSSTAHEATLHDAWRRLEARPGGWCLWWTADPTTTPTLLATRGLPHDYDVLLESAHAAPSTRKTHPSPLPRIDDPGEDLPLADIDAPVLRIDERRMTVVCADDGAGRAAHAIRSAARMHAGVIDALRGGLLALHTMLRQRGDHLAQPLAVDGAVVAAQWSDGQARLLRIGAAAAWHWRRGQLRAVFANAPARSDGGLDDLLFGPAGSIRPGLGGAAVPHVDEAVCALAPGDRLMLVATRALCALPDAWFSDALGHADAEGARRRLASVAGLRSDATTWPIGVIDIPL
ncbi:MAG: hypothetical protein GAK28_00650 [Luteibacter sp.]|uniref:type VI secretion system-associated protein TagF n=1 Tax=Luteibacter sp. TaxID=1886636 RepID=UPI001385CD28|nr:type VI secretion system-associated protein TagF [Luteibacter sp.]KAF1009017.1 MAG: hypothetical protein GAK28_00650 [Luteibacter sp.]